MPDSAPMPGVELPSELWFQILKNLRKPVPEARSNDPRENLRQPDLCSAALVCKSFQSMSQQILFTHIATDRVSDLFPQTSADIPLRRHLFGHTKTLSLEYSDKEEHPSYTTLMGAKGRWERVGSDLEAWADYQMGKCAEEAEALTRCFTLLDNNHRDEVQEIFPLLYSIAVGSIFGGQDHLWRPYSEYYSRPLDAPNPCTNPSSRVCSMHFHAFFQFSPLRHLCVRSLFGPLRQISSTFAPVENPRRFIPPSLTAHFTDVDEVGDLPISYGRMMRWVFDSTTPVQLTELFPRLGARVENLRESSKDNPVLDLRQPSDTIQLALVCTPAFDGVSESHKKVFESLDETCAQQAAPAVPEPQAILAHRLKIMGVTFQRKLWDVSGLEERFLWVPSTGVPPCQACGSLPPAIEAAT